MIKGEDIFNLGYVSSALPNDCKPSLSIPETESDQPLSFELYPISSFTCYIEYQGESRYITCRRYDITGTTGYVGAICHSARGYRQFRCDRIEAVYDASTGEHLGSGDFFHQFIVDRKAELAPTWNLTPSRRATLVAGLVILSFMARCDGHWHPLESDAIEDFVCALWLRKEWETQPPIDEIIAHSHRLAPDSVEFFKALRRYANSQTSRKVLRQAISKLVSADGAICGSETQWAIEIDAFFNEYDEEAFNRNFTIILAEADGLRSLR